tara:strand:+ start:182 stop:412 length:231 start_codon:yes stop_codon:yes gene_type:complete
MSIKIDIKTILPYLVLIGTILMTWGMWSERLNAVEEKADSVAKMQQDIAVIKTQIESMNDKMSWMEDFLIKNYKEF